MPKSLRQLHFLLLLNPFSGLSHCIIQGAAGELIHNLNSYMNIHSCACFKILTTHSHSLNGEEKKCHWEITLVNISKILILILLILISVLPHKRAPKRGTHEPGLLLGRLTGTEYERCVWHHPPVLPYLFPSLATSVYQGKSKSASSEPQTTWDPRGQDDEATNSESP